MSYSDAEKYRLNLERRMEIWRVTICSPYAIDCLLPFSLIEKTPTNWYEKAVDEEGAFPHKILEELKTKGLLEYSHHKHPSGDLRKAIDTLKQGIQTASLGAVIVENGRQFDHTFSVKYSQKGEVLVYDLKEPYAQRISLHDIATRVIINGSPDHDMYLVNRRSR